MLAPMPRCCMLRQNGDGKCRSDGGRCSLDRGEGLLEGEGFKHFSNCVVPSQQFMSPSNNLSNGGQSCIIMTCFIACTANLVSTVRSLRYQHNVCRQVKTVHPWSEAKAEVVAMLSRKRPLRSPRHGWVWEIAKQCHVGQIWVMLSVNFII